MPNKHRPPPSDLYHWGGEKNRWHDAADKVKNVEQPAKPTSTGPSFRDKIDALYTHLKDTK